MWYYANTTPKDDDDHKMTDFTITMVYPTYKPTLDCCMVTSVNCFLTNNRLTYTARKADQNRNLLKPNQLALPHIDKVEVHCTICHSNPVLGIVAIETMCEWRKDAGARISSMQGNRISRESGKSIFR